MKRMTCILLTLCMAVSLCCMGVSAAARFTDVPDSFWASKEIAWAVDKGIVNGTTSTTFSPNDKTLRGQMTAILYRYAGEPAVSGASSFSDVNSSIYYADAASWAQKNNILISTVSSSDKFLGGNPISRAEFCAMIYNYAGYKSVDRKTASSAPFSDVKGLSSELLTAINWAYANGIVNGVDKTHFSPDSTLTRAQAVVMLYRYENKFASGGTETNPSTEIPTKPDGTTKTYTGADVTAEYKSKAVGTLGSYFEVNVPVGQKVYFGVSDNSGKSIFVDIKDGNGLFNHTTDIGFIGVNEYNTVMVEGYKAGTMVVNLFKSDETNGTLSTVVIHVGGSTCSVAITTPSGTSIDPDDAAPGQPGSVTVIPNSDNTGASIRCDPSTKPWTGQQGRAWAFLASSQAEMAECIAQVMDSYPTTLIFFSNTPVDYSPLELLAPYEISHGLHNRMKSICYDKYAFSPARTGGNYYEYRLDLHYSAAGIVRMYREGVLDALPDTEDSLWRKKPADYTLLLQAVEDVEDTYGLTSASSDYDKALAAYRYLTENCTYDYYMASQSGNDLIQMFDSVLYPDEINYMLTYHKGVCFEYALTYQALCYVLGLDCYVVSGNAGGAHAWNIVQVDGQWYQADATWDAGKSTYNYFLVSDRTMSSRTVTPGYYDYPACPYDYAG